MKRINIKIPAFILFILLFLGADSIISGTALVICKIIFACLSAVDSYIILMDYKKFIGENKFTQDNEFIKLKEEIAVFLKEQKVMQDLFGGFGKDVKEILKGSSNEEEHRNKELKTFLEQERKQNTDQMNTAMRLIADSLQYYTNKEDERAEKLEDTLLKQDEKLRMHIEVNNEKLISVIRMLIESCTEQSKMVKSIIESENDSVISTMNEFKKQLQEVIAEMLKAEEEHSDKLSELLKNEARQNTEAFENAAKQNALAFEAAVHAINSTLINEKENMNDYFAFLERKMGDVINRLIESQREDTKATIEVLNTNKELNVKYLSKLEDLSRLQEAIAQNEMDIKDSYGAFNTNISNAVIEFVKFSEVVTGHINELKSLVKNSMDKMNLNMKTHYDSMGDILSDSTDEFKDALKEYVKNQNKLGKEQTASLTESIKQIEVILNSQIREVLEKNNSLLDYLEKMQDEWTSLNKSEIDFLNKVWNKK